MTIRDRVLAEREALEHADRHELVEWANAHGIDNRSAWGHFKKALIEIGVDFDAMRAADREGERQARVAAARHRITLFSDAKASHERFAICNANGDPVWHGRFFDDDRDFDGEQSSGELAAAKKAVWLASKVAERHGTTVLLDLRVDAEWLTWANATDGRGGKAQELARAAARLGVALEVHHIPGALNPADRWTVAKGFKKWQDGITEIELEEIAASASPGLTL